VSKCSELRKSNNQEPEIDTDEVAPNIKRVDKVNKNIPSNENLDEFKQDEREFSLNGDGLSPDHSILLGMGCG
jgi:hypothetical protein